LIQADNLLDNGETGPAPLRLGFTGTPAFVIGDALVPGAVPRSDLEAYLQAARDTN
jgi:protein-disulfide isomerase